MKHIPASLCLLMSLPLVATAQTESTDPRRPPAIEAKEVPIVPPEVFARLAQYQSIRGAAFRGWAPDGSGILIATRFANAAQLHRVFEPGGRREQITFFEEPVSGRFIPKATDGSILMLMDKGGNENDQVHLLDRRRFSSTLLTDGKSKNRLEATQEDGSRIIIASNQRNGRDMDLYLADPHHAGSMKLLMQVDNQSWSVSDWTLDGSKVLLNRYVSANESYPEILEIASGKRTDLDFPKAPQASPNEKVSFGPMAFSSDGKSILLATDSAGEFRRLARLELENRKVTWLTDDIPWDVSDIAVSSKTGDVAFAINEDGVTRLYLMAEGNGPRRELKIPLGIISGIEFSLDGKSLGFTLSRPDAPADVYSLLHADGTLSRWTFSEVGGLDPESFVAPSRIQFTSFDGRKIPAWYFKPRTSNKSGEAARLPVLINIHGGPESQYQPFFTGNTQYQVNELGLAVICPNVRGSAGYGKTYLALDNAEKREDSVKDIGALLDWIGQQPELDSSRVVVTGGSYGGYMVLASLTHFGDRLAAGIDNVGIANFITFLERTAPYRVDLRRAEYGDERNPEMRATFERISPLNNAHKIRSALMVIHGKNDPRVPFYEAEQIAAKVRESGKPVWTLFASNEGHGFSKKDNSDYQRAVEVMFLRKHLGLK